VTAPRQERCDAVPASPEDQYIDVQNEGVIGWLILNRPDRLNAMNGAMLAQFSEAVDTLEADPSVRVIIIRGAGRAFSTGYDIERRPEGAPAPRKRDSVEDFVRLTSNVDRFLRLWECRKPVIAAVHGYCLAGATQMCVFCDLTIVADDAVVGMPKIPVGGGYITPMWTWLVGPKRAKQMSFSAGRSISGKTAADWGWANYSVPADELFDEVRTVALDFARTPASILAMKKYAINRVVDIQGFRTTVGLGAETDALLHESEAVELLSSEIREQGLKQAIKNFEDGKFS
jgi:enoyl-CoA hydratase/carnithine racemase